MKRFVTHKIAALCFSGILAISTQAHASAFQLWEQDGASIANYHAGYAALATDASIAWYNPAGMVRIKDQQLVLGAVAVTTAFKYRGSVTVIEPHSDQTFTDITAQGGTFNLVPDLHYVAPINDCVSFGLSIAVPFGLKTDYGRHTALRYAATLTSISVVDLSPSLAVRLTDQASLGFGLDFQKNDAEFDSIGVINGIPDSDTSSTNRVSGWGYGYHAGILYEICPTARAGLSYHSQVRHHLRGSSKFVGPTATALNDGPLTSKHAFSNITLPPYTALSYYQDVCPRVSVMATVIFTQWSKTKDLILNDYAGAISPEPFDIEPSTGIQIVVPDHYRNTWNVSIGADYHLTDQIILRGGVGYDETPVKDTYRNVQLPDNNRYVFAIGGHYQANKCLGFDLGWMHVMSGQAHVNPPPQPLGGETIATNGNLRGAADVYGAQITWNI